MQTMGQKLWLPLFFALLLIVKLRGEEGEGEGGGSTAKSLKDSKTGVPQTNDVVKSNSTYNDVAVKNKKKNNGGGGGGVGWGWGGGGGGGNRRGGWGWGGGGGGGVYWRWGCGRAPRRSGQKRVFSEGDYKTGEFAQCMVKGRCMGMRLDCPLHCGGPCFYDCRNMCKAHCKR